MTELEWGGHPERPMLRRAIRHRLRSVDPTLRVVAEGFLADSTEIDLLAVGGEGEMVGVRVGTDRDDLALFTHCLADLEWLRPRLADFLKLAPGLGLEPSAAPRAMLLCPEFAIETRRAAAHLPAHTIELVTYRCLRERGRLNVLLETLDSRRPHPNRAPVRRPAAPAPVERREPLEPAARGSEPAQAPPPDPGAFRTGLSDVDLRSDGFEEEKPPA